ncbi:hypothetical protein ACFQ9X_51545 [Catenulispora yoronensis]
MLDDRDRPSDGREDLEAALVLHYSRLVRIAYLALPPEGTGTAECSRRTP